MDIAEVINLTGELIAIPSLSGEEKAVISRIAALFDQLGWSYQRFPVEDDRENLFVYFGEPEVVLTTHVDVVPAPAALFEPRFEDGGVYGRGACDAKGILATMIGTCANLLDQNFSDFGLLVVVGEESDGIGARQAAKDLQGRGIRYLINGEPTEGKIALAHKGGLGFTVYLQGRSAHAGYPELGDDANAKMIRIASELLSNNFGEDPVMGPATVNLGRIEATNVGNVVSPAARFDCFIRTVTDNEVVLRKVTEIVGDQGEFQVYYNCPLAQMIEIPGFETTVASYCTDVPFFAPLDAQVVLYGPGSIQVAHTDNEFLAENDIEDALSGYVRIIRFLKGM